MKGHLGTWGESENGLAAKVAAKVTAKVAARVAARESSISNIYTGGHVLVICDIYTSL